VGLGFLLDRILEVRMALGQVWVYPLREVEKPALKLKGEIHPAGWALQRWETP
jgi:hypothetical protein